MPSRQTIINRATKELLGWRVVLTLPGSKGATHTLESNGTEVKCSCQGFRIHGKGIACKHTRIYADACRDLQVAIGTRLWHVAPQSWFARNGIRLTEHASDGPLYTYEKE